MRDEELPGAVDEQRLQLGDELRTGGQSEFDAQTIEHRSQCLVPSPFVDLHPAEGDLQGVPHAAVEQRLGPSAESCRPGQRTQLTGLRRWDRDLELPEPAHLD